MLSAGEMLSAEDYRARKAQDRAWADAFVKTIEDCPDPTVKYRDPRPMTDIKEMFESSCAEYAENTAFWVKDKKGGEYRPIKYKEALLDVNGLGTALIAGGLKGKRISVVGDNRYQWAVSFLATVCGTGVAVPLDKELPKEDIKQILKRAGVSCVIFDARHEQMMREIRAEGDTELELLISMDREESDKEIFAWKDLVESGRNMANAGNTDFTGAQVMSDEMCEMLFTSGTTGASKGVMISHKNIAAVLMTAPTVLKVNSWDVFFSFLPIHHTYECTCGFLLPLYKGAAIAYCEGLKYIVKNLAEIKPTMFLGVPAVFENLYKKIWQNIRKKGKEETVKKVIRLNRTTKKFGLDLGNLFFKDIRAVFGGRMRMLICGGAAIDPAVLDGLTDFGFTALQGYGLTEAAPLGALNPDTKPNSSSIGRRFPNTDIKIADKGEDGIGEICLKGDNIMLGYYEQPDLTAEVIRDGWFYTGDLGYLDDQGYAYLTGRKKNVIITKNGKNVYPEELEYKLSQIPFVQESMVWGKESAESGDVVITATVVIDDEAWKEQFGEEEMSEEEKTAILWKEVDRINAKEPLFKKIKALVLRKEEFDKNSTRKIKRFLEDNKR